MGASDGVLSGASTVDDVLNRVAHFGVMGMKWGVRRADPGGAGPSPISVNRRPGKRVKVAGGQRHGPAEDAVRAAVTRQKAKKSSVDSLSNAELQALVNRLNLEQQYSRLAPKTASQHVTQFITQTLIGIGKDEASKYAKSTVSSQIASALKKK